MGKAAAIESSGHRDMPIILGLGVLILLAVVFGPQLWVRHVLARHGTDRPDLPGTGAELARHLLDEAGLRGVKVELTDGGDHYDPEVHAVRLSLPHHDGRSVAAVAVAAHEVSHAVQHARGERAFALRFGLVKKLIWVDRVASGILLLAPLVTIDYGLQPNLTSLTGLFGDPLGGLYPTINGTLTLGGLDNGFTLTGFNVTGGTLIHDSQGQFYIEDVSGTLTFDDTNSTGFTGNGIHIKDHKGNIVLNNAIARNNTGRGVFIENQISGNVTIFNSTYYENNGSHGLKIQSKGVVSIDDVHANDNNIGIVVDTCSALIIKNTETNNNRTAGIWVEAAGKPVTLEAITALNNNTDHYDYGAGIRLLTVGAVNAKYITTNSNHRDGFHIEATGAVTLTSITAYENDFTGIYVSTPGTVNINGAVANNNQECGLVTSSRGAILKNIVAQDNHNDEGISLTLFGGSALLENVVANNNGNEGIEIEYDAYPGVLTMPVTPVTLRNVTADDNNEEGIQIELLGAVTIYNTGASNNDNNDDGNDYDGIYIDTFGAVTITGLGAFENEGNGLYVRTKGAITISGIYASNNGLSGADLDNGLCTYDDVAEIWTCLGTGAIQVKNTSGQMNDLSSNDHFGLWAVSKGAITITNLRATDNDSDGVFLRNSRFGSTAGITVNTLGAVRNEFSNNGKYEVFQPEEDDYYMVLANGLSALSGGNISVTNTDAWQNHSEGLGIYLDNKSSIAVRTVTLTNSNAGENDWAGVWIYSRGNITLTNVTANDNHSLGGIHVDNCLDWMDGSEDNICFGSGTVLLTNIDTHNNNGTGLAALSKGTITLNSVNSSNNYDMGISLVNNFNGATAGVSLTNINANDNNNTGLSVNTNGSATLSSINTHNNAKRHGYIDIGQTVQDFFNQNHGPDQWKFDADPGTTYNFRLQADASQVLNRADFDPWIELYDADDPETPLAVTITCEENNYCSFSFTSGDAPFGFTEAHTFLVILGSNSNDGFYRLALNNPVIDDNNEMFWAEGATISAGGSITVRGIDTTNNSLTGLIPVVIGNGGITLSNLQAHNNGTEGVYLSCGQLPDWIDSGFGTGTISISGSNNINDNGWDGLIMATSGNVTISSLEAYGNGQTTGSPGISIREDHAAKAVTLGGINAGENGNWGLSINATGNISLTNVNAWQNYNEGGIFLDNCQDYDPIADEEDGFCFGTGTVRLTTVSADNNQGKGIEAYSKGMITLSGVQANGNWQTGIRVINEFFNATAGIILGTVRADSNGDTGITAWTNGALLMSNVNASSNYLSWGGIDNGTTVQNYYSSNRDPDHWWFEAVEGVPITLKLWADGQNDSEWLNRWDFDPYLQVFDEEGNEITIDPEDITYEYSGSDWDSTDFYQIIWTPGSGESGWYLLEVSSANDSSGFYRLSVDNSDPANADRRWVDGLSYRAGGIVFLSGTNNFSDNEQAGLIGWGIGSVTLYNVFAWGNGTEGIYVDNTEGIWNVTLLGTNAAGSNGWEGLRVITNGAVSLSNLEANHNGQDGIRIAANNALKTVSLNNIVAMWNGISGIEMQMDGGTHGITTLNNVRAWFNNEDGIDVDTNGYQLTLLNSSFMCNNDDGFVYWGYPLPFIFTNTGNIFLGNGGDDLLVK